MSGELRTTSNQEDGEDSKCQENRRQQVTKRTERTASIMRTNRKTSSIRSEKTSTSLTENILFQEDGVDNKCQVN